MKSQSKVLLSIKKKQEASKKRSAKLYNSSQKLSELWEICAGNLISNLYNSIAIMLDTSQHSKFFASKRVTFSILASTFWLWRFHFKAKNDSNLKLEPLQLSPLTLKSSDVATWQLARLLGTRVLWHVCNSMRFKVVQLSQATRQVLPNYENVKLTVKQMHLHNWTSLRCSTACIQTCPWFLAFLQKTFFLKPSARSFLFEAPLRSFGEALLRENWKDLEEASNECYYYMQHSFLSSGTA